MKRSSHKLQNIKQIAELESHVDQLLESKECTHGIGRALRNLKKEIQLFNNYNANYFAEKITPPSEKVQIGGGKHTLEGFFNIDIVPPADLVWDIREGIPLKDNSSIFIFNEHFFEHIDYPVSAKKVVSEFFRILKPSGQIVLGVPDSEMAAKSYVTKDKNYYQKALATWYSNRNCLDHFNTYIDLLNYHFRDQDDDEKYNPHYWAYDYEKLQSLFLEAGFSSVKRWKFDSTIANPKRKWGSIYIIATK